MVWMLAACGVKDTDLGDLPKGSDSGSESGSDAESGSESGTTDPSTCVGEGEQCDAGCCSGFGCDFSGVCVPCTPVGEELDIDGAGCCDGLVAGPTLVCYEPTCDEGDCPEDVAVCGMLNPAVHDDSQEYARDCEPEACLATQQLVLDDPEAVGFECSGISSECDGESGLGGSSFQTYSYRSGDQSLTLRFDAAILDGYSTEAFNEHFENVAGQITVPDASVPIRLFVDGGAVSNMTFADGRLRFTVTLQVDDGFARIESDADDCLADDISGECYCYYEDLGAYDIVVDLPIEAP